MVLVSPIAELNSLQKLVGDVGVAGGSRECGEPIEPGEDAVLDRAWLDHARPANDSCYAEATFEDSALCRLPAQRRYPK